MRAERLPIEEQMPVRLYPMQSQVDRDQHELALDVLVGYGATIALSDRYDHKVGRYTEPDKFDCQRETAGR